MGVRRISWRLGALLLLVSLLVTLTPGAAFAAGETRSASSTTTAFLTIGDQGSKDLTVEALFGEQDTAQVVEPCDIIFIVDQSRWMNTTDDKGETRGAILTAMSKLMEELGSPTDPDQEHRVAIVGYGRINLNSESDYDASLYPGLKQSGGISLGTGYYTASGFVSKNGWSDVSASMMGTSQLPTMATSYKNAMSYDSAFMTLSEADTLLTQNETKMVGWYAGASRMDAGLTIAEQLAALANEHDEDDTRKLIVCIIASSLPIQNTQKYNTSTIRTVAATTAADLLKESGATIFAFGDYHNSGKAGLTEDTLENFNATMSAVCSDPSDYYPLSSYSSVTEAMNNLITKMEEAVADPEEEYTVQTSSFTQQEGDPVDWEALLAEYGDEAEALLATTTATVRLYISTGTDSQGEPTFDEEENRSLEVSLAQLAEGEGLSYTTLLQSFYGPAEVENGKRYKVVITASLPITATYQEAHYVEGLDGSYTLLEEAKTRLGNIGASVTVTARTLEHYHVNDTSSVFTGTVLADGSLILPIYYDLDQVTVTYDLNGGDAGQEDRYPQEQVKYGGNVTVREEPTRAGYTFEGWLVHEETWQAGETKAVTQDITLVAQWSPNQDTVYRVEYYQQNVADDDYTLVESWEGTGTTDTDIAPLDEPAEGFSRSAVTYEDSTHTSQTEPLTIAGDRSLVVKVYDDRILYTVTYDLNGGDPGQEDRYPQEQVKYGTELAVKEEPTREGCSFSTWTVGEEDSYAPQDTLTVTRDVTLVAQWNVTLTYDLDGGENEDVDYSEETVAYDTELVVKDAPIRMWYTFGGWSDGTHTYAPGDTIRLTANTTLTALWTEIPPTGVGTDRAPWALLFLLSGAGAVLFVWARRKKKRKK